MKGNPMDWPARPDLEATIAQQQARIEALEHSQSAIAWAEQLHRAQIAEQALAAERERAEKAELRLKIEHDYAEVVSNQCKLKVIELQAMREKLLEVEHLASRLAEMLAEIL